MKFGETLVSRDLLHSIRRFSSSECTGADLLRRYYPGPFLLGCKDHIDSRNEDERSPTARQWVKLPPHEDEGQVELDVDRSFIYYPTSMQ